jgi:hypothetical protein
MNVVYCVRRSWLKYIRNYLTVILASLFMVYFLQLRSACQTIFVSLWDRTEDNASLTLK